MSGIAKMFDLYAEEKGFGPRIVHLDDIGFAIYHLNGHECYIEEIFVLKEKRRDHLATKIADMVTVMAKEKGCRILTGSVVPHANGADTSRKALLLYGFTMFDASEDFEKYSKEI